MAGYKWKGRPLPQPEEPKIVIDLVEGGDGVLVPHLISSILMDNPERKPDLYETHLVEKRPELVNVQPFYAQVRQQMGWDPIASDGWSPWSEERLIQEHFAANWVAWHPQEASEPRVKWERDEDVSPPALEKPQEAPKALDPGPATPKAGKPVKRAQKAAQTKPRRQTGTQIRTHPDA